MLSLAIDIGAENVKAAIVDNGKICALSEVPTGLDQTASRKSWLLVWVGRQCPRSRQMR